MAIGSLIEVLTRVPTMMREGHKELNKDEENIKIGLRRYAEGSTMLSR